MLTAVKSKHKIRSENIYALNIKTRTEAMAKLSLNPSQKSVAPIARSSDSHEGQNISPRCRVKHNKHHFFCDCKSDPPKKNSGALTDETESADPTLSPFSLVTTGCCTGTVSVFGEAALVGGLSCFCPFATLWSAPVFLLLQEPMDCASWETRGSF